ncbi:MAG: hypothetical protein NE334_06840 [Lentisphaeraceae bacterium]|nr:hypothetical protein [Lentisphaeraceae bacterium]
MSTNCPDFEELSAWHDGASSKDLSKHIDSCSMCQSELKNISVIEDSLKNVLLSEAPSADLKDKILKTAKTSKAPIPFMTHILKIAAILITAFAINYFTTQNTESQTNTAQNKTDVKPEITQSKNAVIRETKAPAITPDSEKLPSTEISSKDFSFVGANGETPTKLSTITIENEVKHVWLCQDFAKVSELLSSKVTEEMLAKDSIELKLTLTQAELINKVNSLNKSGCSLVSRELPQPNTYVKTDTPDKKVTYHISIVKKK